VNRSLERHVLDVMAGRQRGLVAGGTRLALAAAEPLYAGVVELRNRLFDAGVFRSHRLPKPAISIGNLTTGGTGKTPMVAWLVEQLRSAGRHPAVLMRGYKGNATHGSDEQQLLDTAINPANVVNRCAIIATPDRVQGAGQALLEQQGTDVFVLDDGFQHRRVRRDFDIVLISATNPFGFGHVLPRGLCRESMCGLSRASAFVMTHASEVDNDTLSNIDSTLRRRNPDAPIYRADHRLVGFLLYDPGRSEIAIEKTLDELTSLRCFIACGIGQPESFAASLRPLGCAVVGQRFFPDHHRFTDADWRRISSEARSAGADAIVVTEKDWVKLRVLPSIKTGLPIWRATLAIQFQANGAAELVQRMTIAADGAV
jgi:tetraacyldisaccharide 4'-kinase